MSQPKTVKKKAGDGKGVARGARHRRARGADASTGDIAGGLTVNASSVEIREPTGAVVQKADRGGNGGAGAGAEAGRAPRRRAPEAVPDRSRLVLHYATGPAQAPDVLEDAEAAAELRQLVVVGHPDASEALLRIVDGLGGLSSLTELWLVEAGLRDVAVVRVCVTLEKLVLSTNLLAEVPDLAPLSRLHTLWLPGNRITRATKLSCLPSLEDLNLADNLICTLRRALTGCKRLTTLNLSGNPLASLKEARHLCDAPALRVLSLADPVYGVTPMARLCNYRSCVLLHLPQLQHLDGYSVEPEEQTQLKEFYAAGGRHMSMLRRHAEARYMLAVRTLARAATAGLQRLRDQFFYFGQKQCEVHHRRVEEMARQMQAQQRMRGYVFRLGAPATPPSPVLSPEEQDHEEEDNRVAMDNLVAQLTRWTEDLDTQLERHRADYEMSFAELECELESVGNVAMSVHPQGSRLANVCQDLLDRFSCGSQFSKWRLRRARVLRVTHVCSRGAEIVEAWRPAEGCPEDGLGGGRAEDAEEDASSAAASQGGRKGSATPSATNSSSSSTAKGAGARSRRGSTHTDLGGGNSCLEGDEAVGVAEAAAKQGVEVTSAAESVEHTDCGSLFQLLCSPARELRFTPWPLHAVDYPALGEAEEPLLVSNCLALADSQWLKRRPPRLGSARRLAPLVRLSKGTRLRRTAARGGKKSAGAEADELQCGMYRVLGPRPELLFLVEFQYECVDGEAADYDSQDQGIEEGLRRMAPWWRDVRAPASVKHPVLDEALLARCVACSDWGRLTAVNLAGRGIKVLGELPLLPCVSHLDLSYNQLGSLGSLYAFPNLRSLNLSFNNFVTLVNMRDLPHLESLNLSWNNIRQLLVVLRSLNKYTAGLRCLQVCHNPVEDVMESAQGRYLAARYLPRLGVLDGEPVHAGPVFLEPPPPPPGPPSGTQSPAHRQGAPLGRVRSGHSPAVRHPAAAPTGRPASSRAAPAGRRSPSRQPLPPQQPPPREDQLPGLRSLGPDELRLRWRADRRKETEWDGPSDCLQPDRYTLSASGRGLTHILDPTAVPWACPAGVQQAAAAAAPPLPAASAASWLEATRWADLSDNLLGEGGLTHVLSALPHLLQLNASRNAIEALPMSCFQHCPGLSRLDLSRNYLRAVPLLKPLQNLQFLDLSSNQLQSLCGLEEVTSLRELHLANNYIRTLQDLQPLRRLQRLCVLDLTGNEVADDLNLKKFVIFHLRNLESVNGQEVMDGDLVAARETFGGCLDRDALLTQYSWKDMTHLVELHLTSASLRQVDLPEQLLPYLEVLDLSHNDLCCLWGLRHLPRLAVLDLSHNQVRCLRPPPPLGPSPRPRRGAAPPEEHTVFPALHTLFLDHNGLSCLAPLELGNLRRLRTLFLQHNQLDSLSGLGTSELRGIVLDGNHLEGAAVQEAAEAGVLREVRDLHLDGNHLQGLGFLSGAKNVARLFVAKNKIVDPGELEVLRLAAHLSELCLLGNPVCLRARHFALMRELLPGLQLLDGHAMDLCNSCPTPTHIPLGSPWGPAGDRAVREREVAKDNT